MIEITEGMKEKIRNAVADAIGLCAYDCNRVWEAWSVGTMSRDDFVPIVDDAERIAEIADAAIAAMTSNEKVSGLPPAED